MSNNLNFEDKIEILYEKIEWINPSIKSKIKRLFKIESSSYILGCSEQAKEFRLNYPEFAREIQNLTVASYNIGKDIEKSPVEKILALNLKNSFNPVFLNIIEAHLYFLKPYSLKYFINLNWNEYLAFLYKNLGDKPYIERLSFLIVEIAYCSTRSVNSYHMFCLRMLEIRKIDLVRQNLDHMRIYLECLNHAEINLVLNRAVIDKVVETYAHLNNINLSGKGEFQKKIDKISKVINENHPMSNHWSAFVKLTRSEQFTNLNSYRTGLVHKFSSKSTAFHKKSFDGIAEGLRYVEQLIKESNHMSFFAYMTLLLSVNEIALQNLKKD